MSRISILPLAALGLLGCASVDPAGTFESTRRLVEGRHPGEVVWLRGADAVAAAEARSRELLEAPLTPDAGAELALLRNPELQATLEELGIAQAELAQASRISNPGISFARLSGSGARQRTVEVGADLVDWLVLPLRRRLAEAELERTRLKVGSALLDAVADARTAVVAYQASAELLTRLETIEEIDRSALEYARALFDAGNLTALERANLEATWAETRAEVRRARLDLVRHREEAALSLGLDPAGDWRVAVGLPAPPEVGLDPPSLERLAEERRLDLAAARWAVDVLERALSLKRKTRLAPVGVEVGVERESETGEVDLTGPTIELRLPLFDTGKASIARLGSELAQARWQLQALEARVRSSVRQASAALEAQRELAELYSSSILPLRREVLTRTLHEYNQMLIGTFELLTAKQQEVEAERRALEALAGYWRARFELERAVGAPLPLPGDGRHGSEPPVEHPERPGEHEHHQHQDLPGLGAAAARPGGSEEMP